MVPQGRSAAGEQRNARVKKTDLVRLRCENALIFS